VSSPKAQKAKKARAQKARKAARDARIVEDLPVEQIRKLPKLSETILEFAEPITSQMPDPPRRKDMESAMLLAQIAWNLPLFQQCKVASNLDEEWEKLAPDLPPLARGAMVVMMERRRTVFGGDPRVATVEVRVRDGKVTVYAEARLVSGLSKG
jgi:hypothetical protein